MADRLISEAAAIDAVCMEWCDVKHQDCKHPFYDEKDDCYWCDGCETVLKTLPDLPTAQPERAIKDCRNCKFSDYNEHWNTNFCYYSGDCINWDKWEPTAQPERKKGNWVCIDGTNTECDQCGFVLEDWIQGAFYNFCPNCGADMREGQNE